MSKNSKRTANTNQLTKSKRDPNDLRDEEYSNPNDLRKVGKKEIWGFNNTINYRKKKIIKKSPLTGHDDKINGEIIKWAKGY